MEFIHISYFLVIYKITVVGSAQKPFWYWACEEYSKLHSQKPLD